MTTTADMPALLSQIALCDKGELDILFGALRERENYLRSVRERESLAALTNGDRVRVTDGIRPKYLVGSTGTVTGRKNDRLVVEFDEGTSFQVTNRFGKSSAFPAGCLEKVA